MQRQRLNRVAEDAKTVRGMRWARVAELEMELGGKTIVKYRATTKTHVDIENSGVGRGRLPRSCRNQDWQLVLQWQEVGALALIYRKHV